MTVGFWLAAGAMLLLALAVLLIPLSREARQSGSKRMSAPLTALAIVPVSVGLYFFVTTFDAELVNEVREDPFAMLEALAARLSENPDDPNGWILLGRSYIQLGDYTSARFALSEAWNRTDNPDDTLKMAYAQTLLLTEEGAALTLAGDLVEEVLAGSPGNQAALFYGGLVALERDQPALASERWTAVLATNPPPEIAEIIRTQLVALGTAPPAVAVAAAAEGPVIDLDVRVADGMALDDFDSGSRVYIIARSTDMPMPIAVEQHPLSALPGSFSLSDQDAMPGMPNRSLAQYDEVTVIARISRAGTATEQSGDLFAEATVALDSDQRLSLVIDRIVP